MNQCPSGTKIICYNYKEKGQTLKKRTKPLNRCETCKRIGHKTNDWFFNKSLNNTKPLEKRTVMTQ